MTNKIPVGATIAHGYWFAFREFPKVLGVMWLPLVAQLALSMVVTERITRFMVSLMNRDPAAFSQVGTLVPLYAVAMLLFFSQFTAVTQLTLEQRTVPPWFHFPVGKPAWRMLGAFVLALLALMAAALALLLVGAIIVFLVGAALHDAASGKLIVGLVTALLFLAAYCALILFTFRFVFLLAPATLAEERIGLMRSWQLSYGNFWRMFLITLAIFLPVAIVEYAAILGAIGLPPMPAAGESQQAFDAARLAWNLAMMNVMMKYWFVVLPFFGLLMAFLFGAGCSAQTFAYRKLTEGSAPVAGDALPE